MLHCGVGCEHVGLILPGQAGDGYAKLEVFTFNGGNVTYTSKFTRSGWWNKSVARDDIAPSLTFGVPEPPRLSDKLGFPNFLAPNDNIAVNIIRINNRILQVRIRVVYFKLFDILAGCC